MSHYKIVTFFTVVQFPWNRPNRAILMKILNIFQKSTNHSQLILHNKNDLLIFQVYFIILYFLKNKIISIIPGSNNYCQMAAIAKFLSNQNSVKIKKKFFIKINSMTMPCIRIFKYLTKNK